jgi:hypothetical protein
MEAMAKSKQAVNMEAAGGRIKIQLRARPLPSAVVEILQTHKQAIQLLQRITSNELDVDDMMVASNGVTSHANELAATLMEINGVSEQGRQQVLEFKQLLQGAFNKEKDTIWHSVLDR